MSRFAMVLMLGHASQVGGVEASGQQCQGRCATSAVASSVLQKSWTPKDDSSSFGKPATDADDDSKQPQTPTAAPPTLAPPTLAPPTPAPPTCQDVLGWSANGKTCSQFNASNLRAYYYYSDGYNPRSACCEFGGGVQAPTPSPSSVCQPTCYGKTCDELFSDLQKENYTCAHLVQNLACDCSGCVCNEASLIDERHENAQAKGVKSRIEHTVDRKVPKKGGYSDVSCATDDDCLSANLEGYVCRGDICKKNGCFANDRWLNDDLNGINGFTISDALRVALSWSGQETFPWDEPNATGGCYKCGDILPDGDFNEINGFTLGDAIFVAQTWAGDRQFPWDTC